jgi:hypothetical protein
MDCHCMDSRKAIQEDYMMKELYYDERRLSMGREVSPAQD